MKIENGKFMLGLFDKRDNFPFSIVGMAYKATNLPSNMFYTAIAAKTLRIAKAIITLSHFIHLRSHCCLERLNRVLKMITLKCFVKKF